MHFCGPILPTILPTNPALWERKAEIVVRDRELFSHANQSCANKQAGTHFFQTRDCIANILWHKCSKGPSPENNEKRKQKPKTLTISRQAELT
jgi:hypothetical protein